MIQIKTIKLGYPAVDVNAIRVRVLPFQTSDTTCGTYYELISVTEVTIDGETTVNHKTMVDGNYTLTETEFANWGADNVYVEDVVLAYLQLERL